MINEIIGILSIITTIISCSIAAIQNKKARDFQNKLTNAQKIFAKSNIKFECFQTIFDDLVFVGDFPEKSVIKIPFDLFVGNSGDRKVKKSKLYLTFPDAIHEWHVDNLNIQSKGTFEQIKFKLVDKSEYMHMLGFDYGDIGPGEGILHQDFLLISDYNHTDTTHFELETEVGTADNKKGILKAGVAVKWVIQYFLRHDEGTEVGHCGIQFWNTSKKTLEEYFEHSKLNLKKNKFEEYLKDYGLLSRTFFKKRLKQLWDISVVKSFLLIELDLTKDSLKYTIPKDVPAIANDYALYNGIVKSQKIVLELNNGEFILVDKEEYEKKKSTSNFKITRHYLT